MNVEFKFSPNQKVKLPCSGTGTVSMCSLNEKHQVMYSVNCSAGHKWMPEDQLQAIEDDD